MPGAGPYNEATYLNRGYLAALRGDTATAMEMIAKLDASHDQGWSLSPSAGYVYLALGDVNKFFDYMFAATKDHTLQFLHVKYSPLLAGARKDPRWKELQSIVLRQLRVSR
ncbi:MAG: hypothetical protein ABSA63_08065 [Thermoplasmata archaeon]